MDDIFKGQDDPKKSDDQKVKENFRLILSAEKHPDFSISLLQRSLKITQEPPKGIRPNMYSLYGTRDKFMEVEKHSEFRKAVFGLTWFHTILIERKKFKSLGWNVAYAFNKSDFQVCEDLLAVYMGKIVEGKLFDETYNSKDPIPWHALNTLIADCNYGGRVTDDRDRLLLITIAKEIFNDRLVAPEKWKPPGTEELKYEYPFDEMNYKGPKEAQIQVFTPPNFQNEILDKFEAVDLPVAYGQHVNAEITSMILDTNELLQSILTLTPQDVGVGGEGGGDGGLLGKIQTFAANVPEDIDRFALRLKLKADSQNPLNVVLG
jgi:dynein heavy chain